ncbi:hypothetical protein JXA70_11520 [candidate division KSB1 bacterium]|nr:hypothetical protein [candidate division KSB1 bacterium]
MPVEIRELIVSVSVDESGEESETPSAKPTAADIEDIVSECVSQVLEILKGEKER